MVAYLGFVSQAHAGSDGPHEPAEPSTTSIEKSAAINDRERSAADPYPFSLGLRGFIFPGLGIAGFGAGLDAAYSVLPYLAMGGQVLTYAADQGADPQYCAGCVYSGKSALIFAEGRLWPNLWVTPYARAGAGLSLLKGQRFAYDDGYSETDFSLVAEAGLDLHYRWLSLRVFASHLTILGGKLDDDPFGHVGIQLGTRF